MTVSAGSYQFRLEWILAKKHEEKDVVRYTEPSNKSMVSILVETEMFVIGCKTVNIGTVNENDVIDEWATTGKMIYFFILFFLQYLDISLIISQYSHILTIL